MIFSTCLSDFGARPPKPLVHGIVTWILLCGTSACIDCNGDLTADAGGTPERQDGGQTEDGGQAFLDGGTGNDDDAGEMDAGFVSMCEAYCEQIMAQCVGDELQYGTESDCLLYCESAGGWDEDVFQVSTGNDVTCRLAVLADADLDSPERCAQAGPTGATQCGSLCENYCDAVMHNCIEENLAYENRETCLQSCSHFDQETAAFVIMAEPVTGDTLQCRLWHAGFPAAENANDACSHASASGGENCRSPDPDPNCANYCDLLARHCYDENSMYASESACLGYCSSVAELEEGSIGDAAGNTIGCRIHYANWIALEDPQVGCVASGPSGGDACGSWCDNYCDLAEHNCVGDDELFASQNACMDACDDFSEEGVIGDIQGDTVQCRLHFLGGPAFVDPALYCPVGSSSPTAHCLNDAGDGGTTDGGDMSLACSSYCAQVMTSCTGLYAQYDTYGDCIGYCQEAGGWETGILADSPENTLGCRMYFAGEAALEKPEIYCDRAGFSGADHCGSWCVNYCQVVMQNCADENALYDSEEECLSDCPAFPSDGTPGDWIGDSVQCRIMHGAEAAWEEGNALSCDSAGDSEYGQCNDQNCSHYCEVMNDVCLQEIFDGGSCEDDCNAYRKSGYMDAELGNTLQCRIHYALAAEDSGDAEACAAAGPLSTADTCVDGCDYYCTLMEKACVDGIHDPAWSTTCLEVCAGYPLGKEDDVTGDTYYCRQHKAEKALRDPELYCFHAGELSDVLCVDEENDGGVASDGGGGALDGGVDSGVDVDDGGAFLPDAGHVEPDGGSALGPDAGLVTDGGAVDGDGGAATEDGGNTQDGGAADGGGAATEDGGNTQDGGAADGDGGATTEDGGITQDGGAADGGGAAFEDGGITQDGGAADGGGAATEDGGITQDGGAADGGESDLDGGATEDSGG